MSRDIVADIVRRALAPEPVSADGRPLETPLEQRLRLLHNALGGTQQRVLAQQQKLEKLRQELDDYRALMEKVKQRAVDAERCAAMVSAAPSPAPAAAPVPEPAPAAEELSGDLVRIPNFVPIDVVVPETTTITLGSLQVPSPLSEIREPAPVHAAVAISIPAARLSLAWLPYAALAAIGLSLSLGMSWRQQPASVALKLAPVPPPSVTSTLTAESQISEEESNSETLALVYAYVPPGGKRSVQELLGPELSSSSSESPWTIMRVDDKTTLVSFRPYGEVLESAPVYEFVVDPVGKTVSASPETIASLNGGSVAAR
jgi:hypothetical protein